MVSVITPSKVEYKIADELIPGDDPVFGVVEKKVKKQEGAEGEEA